MEYLQTYTVDAQSSQYGKMNFDIKCLGLNANQDAGSITKNGAFHDVEVQYLTSNGIGVRFNVNDITTYGGAAFKTGSCCGFAILRGIGPEDLYLTPYLFDELKVAGQAYYRFVFTERSSYSGPVVIP